MSAGTFKDLARSMVQVKEDFRPGTETEEENGSENPRNLRELLMNQKHEEEDPDAEDSSEWSEEIYINGMGKSPHLRELLKKHKIEQQHEEKADDESFHDPIGFNETRPRPITLYHRSLFKFKLSCRRSTVSAAPNAPPSPFSLESFLSRESHRPQETADDEFWWKKAMRMTKLMLRSLSFPVQRCYRTSAECCAEGLNYRGFVHATSASRNMRINQRGPHHQQESGERENIRHYLATPRRNSVSEARRMVDCSRDQCGWSQEYSMTSPALFSWESTPTSYDHSNRELLQGDQHHPAQSTVSTFTATTELLFYSSNLMTPYEIHHSFRHTFSVDDTKSRSEVDI